MLDQAMSKAHRQRLRNILYAHSKQIQKRTVARGFDDDVATCGANHVLTLGEAYTQKSTARDFMTEKKICGACYWVTTIDFH